MSHATWRARGVVCYYDLGNNDQHMLLCETTMYVSRGVHQTVQSPPEEQVGSCEWITTVETLPQEAAASLVATMVNKLFASRARGRAPDTINLELYYEREQ